MANLRVHLEVAVGDLSTEHDFVVEGAEPLDFQAMGPALTAWFDTIAGRAIDQARVDALTRRARATNDALGAALEAAPAATK